MGLMSWLRGDAQKSRGGGRKVTTPDNLQAVSLPAAYVEHLSLIHI